ncbi:hypothetical protein M3Y98_01098900 [Aphelenchoides besseyi]|nr:hypothetical protein M3Y98_01098900 [Aphelenchoides besseyi]KAI6209337.1 hypothetical protein M3Y96_00211000 [Aphelenchoides besseyi]
MNSATIRSGVEEDCVKRQNEICQRFVHLSFHKMTTRGACPDLRRQLLILHLLRKAKSDLTRVPPECAFLLENEKWTQTPRLNNFRRSSPAGRRAHRSASRSLTPHTQRTPVHRRLNQQPTAPVVSVKQPKPYVVYSADSDETEDDDPKNLSDEEVFEKENRDDDNVEQQFLGLVGITESTEQQQPEGLSDAFTSRLQKARVQAEKEESPPLYFRADVVAPENMQQQIPMTEDHIVPQQKNSIADYFSTAPLDEDESDGDYSTDDDEYELDGLQSFKRRIRKRCNPMPVVGVRPIVAVAEKRLKDDEIQLEDEQRVPIAV